MPKRIRLTQGKHAIVDAKHYRALVAMGTWCYDGQYAVTRLKGVGLYIKMHHAVLVLSGVPIGIVKGWDHHNRDKLDNRRRNLRTATRSQNGWNAGKWATNKSGFKGVSWNAESGQWVGQIRRNGHTYHLGRFSDPREAARAYDRIAKKLSGRFAFLNFP